MLVRSSRLIVLGTILSLVSLAVPAAPEPGRITVGEFAVKITKALGLPDADAGTASRTLRFAGVHLDPDLDAPLTEGRAADYLRELGIQTTVSGDPETPLSESRASQVASTAALLAASLPDSPGVNGSVPSVCMGVDNRTQCNQCCLATLQPKLRFPERAALICAVMCARVFPTSASASTPSY